MTTAVEGRRAEVEGQAGTVESRRSKVEGQMETIGEGANSGRLESRPSNKEARWREISGLTLEKEKTLSAAERRAAIRKLKAVVDEEIRAELKAAQEDTEFKGERTFLWEPISAICQRLEIGPTVLSRLMRELTGMSTWQMVDKIRAESVKDKLREQLRTFVSKNWRKPGISQQGTRENFWEELKASRRQVNFSYATWAIELGFANYTRFYRACLLCHGQTPSQLEDEVLREYAEWYGLACELKARVEAKDRPWDPNYKQHLRPYTDNWTAALREKPEWIVRMRTELELDESVAGIAGE